MKVKIEISICTGLMLNDHSNPYIESTTVLSDYATVQAFCFLTMIAFIVLLVWILLHLVLGWCKQPSTEAHKADA